MRTETYTITETFYNFDELSREAKDYAKTEYFYYFKDTYMFYDGLKEDLRMLFPNSDLDIQFSFSSCQGDGLNIYGTVSKKDILNLIEYHDNIAPFLEISKYTEDEINELRENLYFTSNTFGFTQNRYYTYSMKDYDRENIQYEIDNWIEFVSNKTPYHAHLIERFMNDLFSIVEQLNKQYEEAGDHYFYDEIEDCDFSEWCDANNYEFHEDGTMA